MALGAETEALFRALARSVWIVTAAAADRRGGLLASWLHGTALSAERPTAVLGLSPNSHTAGLIDRSGAFAAHLLAPRQADLALRFALQSGHDGVDKLASLGTQPSLTGSPLLTDAQGWIECRVAVRQDVGARVLYWCDVVAAQAPGAAALLDERQLIAAATTEQRERLRADRAAADQALREAEQAWRERNRWTPHPGGS